MNRDEHFMRMALRLAERGRGRVEPNPVVGCVIVKGDEVVATGFHRRFGGDHAEVAALKKAGKRARGAELFVTLEPCSTFGKTPPCTDAIIKAGVARVVIAARDPTQPDAVKILRRAGIKVDIGALEAEAEEQNAPFFKLKCRSLPYIIAKWAMTADGKIATHTGDSCYITGERARRFVHRLRARCNAIMVGINTVLKDDPMLDVRLVSGRNPMRIIVDGLARTPTTSRIARTARAIRTIIATTKNAPQRRLNSLARLGCEIWRLRATRRGVDLKHLMQRLGKEQITTVLVEGGGTLHASLLEQDLVDRVYVFVAPKIIGGEQAITPVEGVGVKAVAKAKRLRTVQRRTLGDDILIEYRIHTARDFMTSG